jgi:beta-carotene 3-hydroxylase
MFGMAYMFVHDGLVHRRFTVGPIADFPYLQKVAAAHQVLDFLFGFLHSFFWCL